MDEMMDESTDQFPPAYESRTPRWLLLLVGLLVGAGVTFGITQLAQSESSAVALTARWMAAIESQNLDALVVLYSEDAIWEDQAFGDHFEGVSGIRRGWGIFDLPGFEVREISAVAVDDGGAAVRWTLAGSMSPFTRQPWETTGISVLEISGNEIVAETVYYDSRDLD